MGLALPANGTTFGRIVLTSAGPLKKFNEIAIRVMNIDLFSPITTSQGTAYYIDLVTFQIRSIAGTRSTSSRQQAGRRR